MSRIKRSKDEILFQAIGYLVLGIIGFIMLFPFLILIGSSFASEREILTNGYSVLPGELSLDAYGLIFRNPGKILNAYGISFFITIVGTGIALFVSAMTAYVLSRKSLRHRNALAFYLYFTTLFSGGLAPFYIIVANVYRMRNSILVLLLLPMFNVLYILILRSFVRSIPESLTEAAHLDGAGELTVFLKIILPLTKPALASIGLFTALYYWNDWWTAMMFVEKQVLQPLQYVLYRILSSVNIAAFMVNNIASFDMPQETLKLAMTVVSTGPIIFLYTLVQKYFIKGITLGAIKG